MAISHEARPWRRKDRGVVNSDLDLQSRLSCVKVDIAPAVRIVRRARSSGAEIGAFMLQLQVACRRPVDQPIALDHVKRGAERRAEPIDHREWPHLLADRVDHQRVALIMAYGLALPGGRRM